jgi:nucleolin
VAPPKKVKLANGDAAPAGSSETETKSIFVGKLSWSVDNDRLAQEFAECGEVVSAQVQVDRNTGKSRGFGYVHFTTADAVQKALAMNGTEIDGRAINVDVSTPMDKSRAREVRSKAFGDNPSPPSSTLFIGNLAFSVVEDSLWEVFGEFGDVKSIRLPEDRDTGNKKGFGYVEFSDIESAKKAYEASQGQEIDGRTIRVDYSQPREPGGFGGGRVCRSLILVIASCLDLSKLLGR